MLNNLIYDEFQDTVAKSLLCNRSILDLLAKTQESGAKINRTVIRSVTSCGCLKINAKKNEIPSDVSLEELKNHLESHLEGKMCSDCREDLEVEMGRAFFYYAALCNLLDLNMCDILLKEQDKFKTLGLYMLA